MMLRSDHIDAWRSIRGYFGSLMSKPIYPLPLIVHIITCTLPISPKVAGEMRIENLAPLGCPPAPFRRYVQLQVRPKVCRHEALL